MNFSVDNFKNFSKISSFEKKNLAILIFVKYKLSMYVNMNKNDEFVNKLYDWLDSNIINYKELEILFTTYYNTKEGTNLKNELFKLVKPIEELAIYLKEIALINNKINIGAITPDNILVIKAFVLNLLDYWFNVLKKNTYYYKNIYDFNYIVELEKINKLNKNNSLSSKEVSKDEFIEQLHLIYDNSIEIAEFISNYAFKIIVPNIKGKRKDKNINKRGN